MRSCVILFLARVAPVRGDIFSLYFFGSRARGDAGPGSDYDVLVVLRKKEKDVIDTLYEAVLDVLLKHGQVVSLKLFTLEEFERLHALCTPFIENVLREGVRIG